MNRTPIVHNTNIANNIRENRMTVTVYSQGLEQGQGNVIDADYFTVQSQRVIREIFCGGNFAGIRHRKLHCR